jgi:epoxyqueuosine reductase
MAADMDWMQERLAERLDVTRLVPGARTVVALACAYASESTEDGPIARYARGRDYHYTLQDRLRALRRALRQLRPRLRTYSSVDHGVVLEKVWAVRAGLGYVGKNGCLITPTLGSYVVLAALVMDAEVDAYSDEPVTDRCGKCDLCLRACPTQALFGPRQVDARLCLSYQTIENEGEVPPALRPALANLVFGCDICQSVCPLNDARVAPSPRFQPRAVAGLGVQELAALSPEQFDTLARGTPLVRAGYHGIRRNAAYALGAVRDTSAADVLRTLAADAEPRVREAAQWALLRLDTPEQAAT